MKRPIAKSGHQWNLRGLPLSPWTPLPTGPQRRNRRGDGNSPGKGEDSVVREPLKQRILISCSHSHPKRYTVQRPLIGKHFLQSLLPTTPPGL